jgi:hypothetical protein
VPLQPNRATAMTNNEHTVTLTDAELNEVVGGLNPQPLPPGPPPELSRSIFSNFRCFGINQHFTFTSVFRPFAQETKQALNALRLSQP